MPSLSENSTLIFSGILFAGAFLAGGLIARKFAWPMLVLTSFALVVAMLGIFGVSLGTFAGWSQLVVALTMLQAGYFLSALISLGICC